MEIILSNSSNEPIYQQITSQIKTMIIDGTLKTGDSMPSMRNLAKSLHVSVITAQHAYEDLQKDGFIETVAGKGTFVSAQNKDFIKEEQLRIIEEKIEDIVKIAKIYDVSLENMIKTLTEMCIRDRMSNNLRRALTGAVFGYALGMLVTKAYIYIDKK